MSDLNYPKQLEKVIRKWRAIEDQLRNLGGKGDGIVELCNSVGQPLDPFLVKQIKRLARIRNKYAHADEDVTQGDFDNFEKIEFFVSERLEEIQATRHQARFSTPEFIARVPRTSFQESTEARPALMLPQHRTSYAAALPSSKVVAGQFATVPTDSNYAELLTAAQPRISDLAEGALEVFDGAPKSVKVAVGVVVGVGLAAAAGYWLKEQLK